LALTLALTLALILDLSLALALLAVVSLGDVNPGAVELRVATFGRGDLLTACGRLGDLPDLGLIGFDHAVLALAILSVPAFLLLTSLRLTLLLLTRLLLTRLLLGGLLLRLRIQLLCELPLQRGQLRRLLLDLLHPGLEQLLHLDLEPIHLGHELHRPLLVRLQRLLDIGQLLRHRRRLLSLPRRIHLLPLTALLPLTGLLLRLRLLLSLGLLSLDPFRPEDLVYSAGCQRSQVRSVQGRSPDRQPDRRIGAFHVPSRLRERGLERLRPGPRVPPA